MNMLSTTNRSMVSTWKNTLVNEGFEKPASVPFMRPTTIGGVTYKVADCRAEREAAFRLVYDSYLKSGLIPTNLERMRVTPYHLLQTTDVFVAIHRGKVVYTVTLISDNPHGLPLETIFPSEVEAMRMEGIRVAEVSCLAGRDGYFEQSESVHVFINTIAIMLQYGRYNEIDRLLLAVHPRHAKFYQRLFGCKRNSDIRSYEAVQGNPAVMCSHDFEALETEKYKYYDNVWELAFQRWELRRQPMSDAERWYFQKSVASRFGELVAVGA